MNVRCKKADRCQNPVVKSRLSHASIGKSQFLITLPTRNAFVHRSAERIQSTLYEAGHVPGDHQGTFLSPQYDRYSWASCTGGLLLALRPLPTSHKWIAQDADATQYYLIIRRDCFLDLSIRILSGFPINIGCFGSEYFVLIPPVRPWK